VPVHQAHPYDLAYVIFTSGSTGWPRAVGIEHHALDAHVAAVRQRFGIGHTDRVLAFSSFSFDASLDQVLPALQSGATLVLRPDEQWATAQLLMVVARHRISVLNLPPTYWTELVHSLTNNDAAALATVRLLILGGESIPRSALASWQRMVPWARLCNAYGPTEATVTSTAHDIAVYSDGSSMPIGQPLGGRRTYVVGADDQLVPVGVPGELLIGGPELARGYLNRPALTAQRFTPNPYLPGGGRLYRTGDLARWNPDGTLEILGRTDNQVKVRGHRVELEEIESVLTRHPEVVGAAVGVHPEAHGGQRLVGYVVRNEPNSADPADLRDWCARWLPHYAVPTVFVQLLSLPVNPSGKLDRAALLESGGSVRGTV
jgi:amino acid adenylation domain-containing protein